MKATALAAAIGLLFGGLLNAHAQTAPDFYKGKQIRMIIGHPPGNDYDLGARFLAKYLTRHIPGNPSIIPQNMPQAASVTAANYLYNQAPRDGTTFGTFSRNIPSQALMGQPNVELDPRRLNWLGATSLPGRVCVASTSAKVKAMKDLLTTELIVAGAGASSSLSIVPTVLNHVLGTHFRIIQGYKGTTEAVLATERGEVEGLCATLGQFRVYDKLFNEGKLRILLQAEEKRMPEIADVPSVYELTTNDSQRQFMRFVFSSTEFGRPYAFPPDVPKERVELMRKAFADTLKDPELVSEAERIQLDMTYRPPERLEQLVAALYETPPDMIETIKRLVPNLQ